MTQGIHTVAAASEARLHVGTAAPTWGRGNGGAPFLRALRARVLADFEDEALLVCRLAVLAAAGYTGTEAKRKLGCTDAAYRYARARLEQATKQLDSVPPDES